MNQARMIIDRDYVISRTDPKLFSSFVEPLGRCIYGGLYEPGHPSQMRTDSGRMCFPSPNC